MTHEELVKAAIVETEKYEDDDGLHAWLTDLGFDVDKVRQMPGATAFMAGVQAAEILRAERESE